MKISAAILAGGQGSRMGTVHKEFLSFAGTTLLHRYIQVLRPIFNEILLVTNVNTDIYKDYSIDKITGDKYQGKGPLAGIHAALAACSGHVFVFACDQPMLDMAFIIMQIRQLHAGQDALVPRHIKGIEPLHAIYAQSCLKPAAHVLARNDQPAIREMLGMVNTFYWDIPPNKSFTNLNSPSDIEKWENQLLNKTEP